MTRQERRPAVPAAVVVRMRDGAEVEHTTDMVLRDIRNIADLYIGRFERNYAATGHAMAEDPLAQSDGSYCKQVAENISR